MSEETGGPVDTAMLATSHTSRSEALLPGRQAAQTPVKQAGGSSVLAAQPRELLVTQNGSENNSNDEKQKKEKNNANLEIHKQPLNLAPEQQSHSGPGRLPNQHRVIFSPHYDDAVLSVGGMLSVDPANTTVITVFAGKPMYPVTTAYDQSCHFANSHHALKARSAENKKSLGHLGVASLEISDLDLVDFQYASIYWSMLMPTYTSQPGKVQNGNRPRVIMRRMDRAELQRKRTEELRKKLTTDIKQILNSHLQNGKSVEVYSSLGQAASDHPDHEILNLAIVDLALSMGKSAGVTWLFYEDFPYVLKLADKNETLKAMSQASVVKAEVRAGSNAPKQEQLQSGSPNGTISLADTRKKLQDKLESAIQRANSWTNEAVFAPRMHTFDQLHFQRKKAAMRMYRSQVGRVLVFVVAFCHDSESLIYFANHKQPHICFRTRSRSRSRY